MSYVFYNPNPNNLRVGDCVVRALCKALNKEWETAYIEVACQGLKYYDMPSANYVWGSLLHEKGFRQYSIPSICPACMSVETFAKEHPKGTYVLGCQSHVVTVVDGNIYDSWDSSEELVLFYWAKEE